MKKIFPQSGFTLVELLVTLGILAFLISMILFAINPLYQYLKAFDGQRKQDLVQVRNALDTYYNDHNCYPDSVPFGEEWIDGEVMLMKKVPQDPYVYYQQGRGWYYYNYSVKTGEGACSQWNVLYTRLTDKSYANSGSNPKSCLYMLRKICPGIPVGSVYNYCIISGTLNCDELRAAGVPGAYQQQQEAPTPTPTGPVGPTNTPTPTPTTAPIICGGGQPPQYDCRGLCNQVCNVPPDDYDSCIAKGAKYCNSNCDGNCN